MGLLVSIMIERDGTEQTAWESAKAIFWLFMMSLLVFVVGLCSGCATMSGFGEDVKAVSDGYRQQQALK